MTAYAVAATEIAAYDKTLVASTVDTVTFDRDCEYVRVTFESGSAAISISVNGTPPTVNGAGTYRLRASAGASIEIPIPTAGDTVVKLISSGTPTYSVEGSI